MKKFLSLFLAALLFASPALAGTAINTQPYQLGIGHAANVASASTLNLENTNGDVVEVTGTTTITAITLGDGKRRFVQFADALILTNGANLVLPGAANITTAAGDWAVVVGYPSGKVYVPFYQRASGRGVAGLATQAKDDVDIDGGVIDVDAGGSSSTVRVGGIVCLAHTSVGNVTTGEDNLQTCTLPANVLNAAGRGVKITAIDYTAGNANAKTIKLYFGSTAILTKALTTSIIHYNELTAYVVSTGTDAQVYRSFFHDPGASYAYNPDIELGTATEDDGATIEIRMTGEGVSTNDIVQILLVVEVF